MRFLVLDFDHTLCATPHTSSLGDWVKMLHSEHPDPVVRGAREWLQRMLAPEPPLDDHRFDCLLVLTARSMDMCAVTTEWIHRKLPELQDALFSFRHPDDKSVSHLSKRHRLRAIRGLGDIVELVDDDPRMRSMLDPSDVFYLAPPVFSGPSARVQRSLTEVAL